MYHFVGSLIIIINLSYVNVVLIKIQQQYHNHHLNRCRPHRQVGRRLPLFERVPFSSSFFQSAV